MLANISTEKLYKMKEERELLLSKKLKKKRITKDDENVIRINKNSLETINMALTGREPLEDVTITEPRLACTLLNLRKNFSFLDNGKSYRLIFKGDDIYEVHDEVSWERILVTRRVSIYNKFARYINQINDRYLL